MESVDPPLKRRASQLDDNGDPLTRLQYAVRCLNAPSNVRSTALDVAQLYFALPPSQQSALPIKLLRQIFRAIVSAVLDQRNDDATFQLRQGLDALPVKQFLERFSETSPDNRHLHPNNVNELLLLWIKALLHAEMPDAADRLYAMARSNGHLSSEKLNMDEIVGPLVVLQEWGLVLKWTKGRMCSVGVHAMRMRAFSALGTPQMAIADYEQHEEQLRAEYQTMVEAMKAYYMTIRKELVRQGRTSNRQFIAAVITAVRDLGFTPLMEKTIIKDLQHNGSTRQHVPLLNLLLKQRIENGLSISPLIELYPVTQAASETLDGQSPILLDQHTLALMLEDQRSFSDISQLRAIWADVLANLPERRIASHLVAALVKSLLRLDQWEEAIGLLRNIVTHPANTWIDRPTDLHAGVFNPLIGYLARHRGIEATISVFRLMQSSGCQPSRKTIIALVDGLSQHHLLQPSVRDEFYHDIVRSLPSQLRAGLVRSQFGYGVRTALRNHALQQEIQLLPDGRSEEDTHELSNLFEWKHLPKHLKLATPDKLAKRQISGPFYWASAKSPTPAAIFAAAIAKGFPLDASTCETILRLYIARGHLARAQEIMLLSWQRGIIPSMEMWTIFVKGLADANQLEFLGRRIDAMKRDASSNGLSAASDARSMSLAGLTPNQATFTRIMSDLIDEGSFRQACQVAKYALSSASKIGEDPDVGLLALSFEAFIRAKHTRKARDLLRDPPVGYGPTLRAATGSARVVLLKALRRARAWYRKHQDVELADDIDAFLQSMSRIAPLTEGGVERELIEADRENGVKRTGLTLGELKGLEENISQMLSSLWPNIDQTEDGNTA
jgi:pentatricopeptide repeat protein